MNLFGMLEISGSGMTAERQRAQVVVSNMANAQTTHTPQGGPYQRQLVVFRAQREHAFPAMMTLASAGGRSGTAEGVRIEQVVADRNPPLLRYEPGNPDADAKGYVPFLRIGFQASLASAEHFSYRDFVGNLPERSYLSSVKLAPFGGAALIQMDFALAFPLIDLLLGGEGTGKAPEREITEIEDQILETVMRIICRELQVAWQPLGMQFQFDQRQQASRVQHLLAAEEKVLGLSFEIKMKESSGLLSIAVPAVFSNALLRKISVSGPHAHSQLGSQDSSEHLRRRLQDCRFRLDLDLAVSVASAEELSSLAPGRILTLRRRVDGAAQLACKGVPVFNARIARAAGIRAAQVVAPEGKTAWQRM